MTDVWTHDELTVFLDLLNDDTIAENDLVTELRVLFHHLIDTDRPIQELDTLLYVCAMSDIPEVTMWANGMIPLFPAEFGLARLGE